MRMNWTPKKSGRHCLRLLLRKSRCHLWEMIRWSAWCQVRPRTQLRLTTDWAWAVAVGRLAWFRCRCSGPDRGRIDPEKRIDSGIAAHCWVMTDSVRIASAKTAAGSGIVASWMIVGTNCWENWVTGHYSRELAAVLRVQRSFAVPACSLSGQSQ